MVIANTNDQFPDFNRAIEMFDTVGRAMLVGWLWAKVPIPDRNNANVKQFYQDVTGDLPTGMGGAIDALQTATYIEAAWAQWETSFDQMHPGEIDSSSIP